MATTKTKAKNTCENVWSDEERAAMQESARERKTSARRGKGDEREEGLADLLGRIAAMPDAERPMAERLHAIVTAAAPALVPRTYYGMPAYAKDGKTICFFQPPSKFKVRYWTLGFQPEANLDNGTMWPTSWAMTKLTKADEEKIGALVKQAAS